MDRSHFNATVQEMDGVEDSYPLVVETPNGIRCFVTKPPTDKGTYQRDAHGYRFVPWFNIRAISVPPLLSSVRETEQVLSYLFDQDVDRDLQMATPEDVG